MFLINDSPDGEELSCLGGSKIGSIPTTYLNMLLGASFKDRGMWLPLLEKLRGKASFMEEEILD